MLGLTLQGQAENIFLNKKETIVKAIIKEVKFMASLIKDIIELVKCSFTNVRKPNRGIYKNHPVKEQLRRKWLEEHKEVELGYNEVELYI